MKKLPSAILSAILLPVFYSPASNACGIYGGADTHTASFGAVTVARDIPVGTVIATVTMSSSKGLLAYCSSSPYYRVWEMLLEPTGLTNVYATNVSGVGIQAQGGSTYYTNPAYENRGTSIPMTFRASSSQTVRLIKTGDIAAGTIAAGRIATLRFRSSSNSLGVIINIAATPISIRSCTVLNSAVTINLGNVQRRENFTGHGSTANAQAFSIPLNCGANTPVSITLDNVNPLADEANGVLAANPGSTAQGVGVQVRHNNTPVKFGQLISYGNASGGNINIPFEAQFYQTGDRVLPGSVNATATFTMTYQ